MTDGWSVPQAQRLFTEAQDNADMAIVDADNRASAHWFGRWQYLVEKRGCPKVTAYDTVAARARKSRRTIQNIVRVYLEFDPAQLEEYSPVGITFLTAAITLEEPLQFLDEAMRHPNTALETLLMEYEPRQGEDAEYRPLPPYHRRLWGVGRILASLPTADKARAERHLTALNMILERNGIE